MNGKDILNSLGYIDDKLIQEAEQSAIKGASIKRFMPFAAGICAITAAFTIFFAAQNMPPYEPGDISAPIIGRDPSESDQKYALHFNNANNGQLAYDRTIIKGHFWETLTPAQAKELLPIIAEKYYVEGIVNYSHHNDITSIFSIGANVKTSGEDAKITIAPHEVTKCYLIDGEPILSEIEGIKIEAGLFVTDKNSMGLRNYIYYADFKIGDIAYYVEYSGKKDSSDFFTSIVADIVLGGKADLSSLQNPVLPELRDDNLTEQEAYAEADFGSYLPRVPKNYALNSATRFINQSSNYLRASWSQGYNDITITISKLNKQDEERIVSIADTDLYDMSLYPIPWADSMPNDTREIIQNPIFKIEDLSLSVLKMREYTRAEYGDPSGNSLCLQFSVLYDNILIELSTEGISSESLLEALAELPRE